LTLSNVEVQANFTDGSASYTAYHYPGFIAGNSFGFNSNGISASTNALSPVEVVIGGIGRQFIARDVLNATSLQDAFLKTIVPNRAYGFNINIASITEQRIINIEIAPETFASHEVLLLQGNTSNNYSHTNLYKILDVLQYPDNSSTARQQRINQLPAPENMNNIISILGDTANKEYPIYRDGAPPDIGIITVATGAFDLIGGQMYVYQANPKTSIPALKLSLLF